MSVVMGAPELLGEVPPVMPTQKFSNYYQCYFFQLLRSDFNSLNLNPNF